MSWTEQHRPQTIDEVVGHDVIKTRFKDFLQQKEFPNIMLYGDPGVGKTTLIRAFGKEFYGSTFSYNFKESNASDKRKIDEIRALKTTYLKQAAKGGHKFKIMYLGEIDGLTHESQDALKRMMETSHRTVRWFADCNSPEDLIPAIQDRFAMMWTRKLTVPQIREYIRDLNEKEDIGLSPAILDHIATSAEGSLRFATNILELMPKHGAIDLDYVQQINPYPTQKKVIQLLNLTFKGTFVERKQIILELAQDSGNKCIRVLEMMYDLLSKKEHKLKPQMLEVIAHGIDNMMKRCNPVIQLEIVVERIRQVLGLRE